MFGFLNSCYYSIDWYFRYDATSEDLIDVIEGNRVYIPCIYVLNKVRALNVVLNCETRKQSFILNILFQIFSFSNMSSILPRTDKIVH